MSAYTPPAMSRAQVSAQHGCRRGSDGAASVPLAKLAGSETAACMACAAPTPAPPPLVSMPARARGAGARAGARRTFQEEHDPLAKELNTCTGTAKRPMSGQVWGRGPRPGRIAPYATSAGAGRPAAARAGPDGAWPPWRGGRGPAPAPPRSCGSAPPSPGRRRCRRRRCGRGRGRSRRRRRRQRLHEVVPVRGPDRRLGDRTRTKLTRSSIVSKRKARRHERARDAALTSKVP